MTIAELKQSLPLPELAARMGYTGIKPGKCHCPLHDDRVASLSVMIPVGGGFRWKCWAGCGSGDEVDFIEKAKGCDKKEAVRLYNEFCGATITPANARGNAALTASLPQPTNLPVPAPAKPPSVQRIQGSTPDTSGEARESAQRKAHVNDATIAVNLRRAESFDWDAIAAAFTDEHAELLHSARGYSHSLIAWLRQEKLIGVVKGQPAFPVTNGSGEVIGAHYRKPDKSWRYMPKGVKSHPWLIGDPVAHAFESQWDMLTFIDASGERTGLACTRGASNALDVKPDYVWPQNDEPGQAWAVKFPEAKVCIIPKQYKDLNEWRLAGATDSDVFNAVLDAKPISPAPVLAEPHVPTVTDDGEARESTTHIGTTGLTDRRQSDSRGGGTTLSGKASESNAIQAEVIPEGSGNDKPPAQILTLPQALDACVAFFLKYVRFPEDWHANLLALWAAYCWVWRAFYCTPYLLVRGPEQNCGKTLVLQCLLALCPKVLGNAIIASISEAALFRSVHAQSPVLLIDEVDKFFARGTEDPIVGILNAGYKFGAVSIRCVGQSKTPETFNVYCPKAFAGIGDMVDNTTASRAIHIHMARQNPDDRATIFREEEIAMEVAAIRTFLGVWSDQAVEALRRSRPDVPDEIKDGRQIGIIEPLLAIADMAGGEWPDKAREAAVYAFQQPAEDSEGTKLLRSIRAVFETKNIERIPTQVLIGDLIAIEDSEAPWSGWWERDYANGRWHGAAGRIARMLKLYGIHPKNIRTDDDEVHKGYVRGDFEKAWKKYLPRDVERVQAQLL